MAAGVTTSHMQRGELGDMPRWSTNDPRRFGVEGGVYRKEEYKDRWGKDVKKRNLYVSEQFHIMDNAYAILCVPCLPLHHHSKAEWPRLKASSKCVAPSLPILQQEHPAMSTCPTLIQTKDSPTPSWLPPFARGRIGGPVADGDIVRVWPEFLRSIPAILVPAMRWSDGFRERKKEAKSAQVRPSNPQKGGFVKLILYICIINTIPMWCMGWFKNNKRRGICETAKAVRETMPIGCDCCLFVKTWGIM